MGFLSSDVARREERGISLVLEIVIGLGIFLIAFLLSYGVFPLNQRALAEARNQLVANGIARQVMNVERERKTARVAGGGGDLLITDVREGNHVVEGRDSRVDYNVEVKARDGDLEGTRVIEVSVTWTYGGVNHRTDLASVVSPSLPGT